VTNVDITVPSALRSVAARCLNGARLVYEVRDDVRPHIFEPWVSSVANLLEDVTHCVTAFDLFPVGEKEIDLHLPDLVEMSRERRKDLVGHIRGG